MSETSSTTNVKSAVKGSARRILTYHDLEEEEVRLSHEFNQNKKHFIEDLNVLQLKLQPAGQVLSFIDRLAGGHTKPTWVAKGADIAIDLLSKKYLFRKSGWLLTLAGSYLARGISRWLLLKNKARKKNKVAQISSNGLTHSNGYEMQNQ